MTICGTGGWVGPLPGDPDNNLTIRAVPAFGGVDVSWTYPTINAHAVAHALLHRGITADPLFASPLAVVAGNTYYDKIDSGVVYYYWIRVVSVNGTLGDWIGPASSMARPLIGDLIEALTGQIDNGVLALSLKSSIDNIALNYNELLAEIQSRVAGDAALSAALLNVQNGIDQALAFISSETTSRVNGDSALITQVDTQAALNAQTAAALLTEQTARVDGDNALASQITTAQSSLNGQIASVQTALSADIAAVDGEVTNIGALYTAKVQVNGLIGGFGVYNNGTEVEAGFDVDRFWVGRTGSDQKKPFIIENGEVFINEAAINTLTINKLRDEAGRFVVENGGLVIRNAAGDVIFGAGTPLNWSNLAVGIGANLLVNSDLAVNASSWALGWNQSGVQDITTFRNLAGPDWQAVGTNNYGITRTGTPTGVWDAYNTGQVPVVPGQRYEVSAYMASHRCQFSIGLLFYGSTDNLLLEIHSGPQSGKQGGRDLANWAKVFAFATAPAGARYVRLVFRSHATGEATPYTWITQPFLGVAGAAQTTPSPWSASNFSERITPANASTWIADAAIGSAQIGSIALVGTSNFSVKSGVSGQRMEMDSRVIKIFDASGVKRVQIGDLTL